MSTMNALPLESLDREELLYLVRALPLMPSERDILRARWEVASDRAQTAWEKVKTLASSPSLEPVFDSKISRRARTEALAVYARAEIKRDDSIAKAEKLSRRADALWEKLQDLTK